MIVDIKELKNIRENYPEVWEWMGNKANWEQISMGAVLNGYKNHIEKMKISL